MQLADEVLHRDLAAVYRLFGAADYLLLHAELARDKQRVAAPRYAYQDSVGRRKRRAVEFHARGLYAVGGERVALYRIVVRRRKHQRAALAQPVEQRDAERRALLGVRARA